MESQPLAKTIDHGIPSQPTAMEHILAARKAPRAKRQPKMTKAQVAQAYRKHNQQRGKRC